jgi:hypothetical protein
MPKPTVQSPKAKLQTTSVIDRIETLTLDNSGQVKMCCYGQSGKGKTTLWSTFPKPILAIISSGSQGETKSVANVSGIQKVELQDEAELEDLAEHVRKSGKFKSTILDHVTSYSDLILAKILGLQEAPQQLAWGTATQEQWGQVTAGLKTRIKGFLDLPCHVYIAAQERVFNNEGGAASEILTPYVGIGLTPSAAGWLGPAVDYLVQAYTRAQTKEVTRKIAGKDVKMREETGKTEYCLRLAPHPIYNTKFRVPKGTPLPECLVDDQINFENIYALISGKRISGKV